MYKARLIIKGYSQKPSLDYKKAFSLVTILKSITMLLSIMVHLDFETWQIDVKTTFSNMLNERYPMPTT